MVRKFKLINSIGEELDLMKAQHYLNSPDGLGFSMANSYVNIGDVYALEEEVSNQKVVTGEMVFTNYKEYQNFVRFISHKPLRFGYKPVDTWAYLSGSVTNLGKSEVNPNTSVLHCPIDFTATTKWFVPRRPQRAFVDSDVQPKKYEYPYPHLYIDAINGYFYVTNNGTESCPAIVTIMGHALNPKWSLSQGSTEVVSNYVNREIFDGEKLVINSADGEREIAIYDADGNRFDAYQSIDFNKKVFIMIPPGDSMLRITEESGNPIDAILEIEDIYETV